MEKPFIKLLRSPYHCYFYEVNRNEIVRVDADVFAILEKVLAGVLALEDALRANERLANIAKLGYLSCKRPSAICHPMLDKLENLLARKVEKITLQLTQRCNFRCKYCAYSGEGERQRAHANKMMSLETALQAIDFYFEHSRDMRRVNIGFYGGEPLLAFDLLTKAVAYAEDKFEGKDLSFAVTTNGSILREDIVEFCLAHKVNVLISIDGPKEIHDKNRRLAGSDEGTFDLIMQNLQRVKATHPDFLAQVSINMVMDPRNDADCTNQLFAQYDIFARDRSAATVANTDFISDAFDATEEFLTKNTYHRFLAFMHHFGRVREDQVSTLQRTMVNRFLDNQERMAAYDSLPDVTAPGGPCLPGVARPLVDVDGNIFPCERCSETAQVMCIGSLDRGFDLERAKAMLNIGALTQEDCRNCWAFSGCEICARSIEDGDVFSAEKKRQRCARLRDTMERDLLERIMLHEVKRGVNQPEEEIVHA